MTKSYLNTENIRRSSNDVEYHPLIPFLPHHNASDGASISTIPTSSTIIGASRDKCSLAIATTLSILPKNVLR